MRAWGTRYWKLDFFDLQTSAAASRRVGLGDLYKRSYTSFRQAAGTGAHLAPCSCPTNLQAGYADSVRVAADIGNAGSWPGAWKDFRYGMATVAGLWYKNRNFWVNDPDSIQIAKGCSFSEVRVRATVVALSGGHLMLSEDLQTVDAARIEMIRRLLPPHTSAARPLDLFASPFPEGYPSLWALTVQTADGPFTVLAAFNLADRTRSFTIEPAMLGISGGEEFLAIEWWQCRWLGRFARAFALEVPAEDVAVIHARPCGSRPSLLTTSCPLTGPWIVERTSFDEVTGVLSGTVVTKAGLRLLLFGHLPRPWTLERRAAFHGSVSSAGGWQSELVTTAERTPFEVRFQEE